MEFASDKFISITKKVVSLRRFKRFKNSQQLPDLNVWPNRKKQREVLFLFGLKVLKSASETLYLHVLFSGTIFSVNSNSAQINNSMCFGIIKLQSPLILAHHADYCPPL